MSASNSENNHHPVVQTKSSRLGITIPWLGTLPKTKNKSSHPAPHHEQKSTLVVSSKTSSSSSSSSSNNTNTASATLTP